MFITNFISKVIGDKTAWRQYKARARQLPPSYRTALEALERYLMYLGGAEDGTAMFADLLDLFEQSVASRTPIQQVVGDDPVEFIETFIRNYPRGQWIDRERDRLIGVIQGAVQEGPREI